ncbi:CO(2)-response secreted protease-like [Coffea eugenioides]|uniref:CO(2)-response secreted protease-like n=1 Tax=Coffea eugenioides TaxID=49369 RepID=UPI000F609782|nr:CO(2)-response secreted protease-like [Coffea eugenioides]
MEAVQAQENGVYIVYKGAAATSSIVARTNDYVQILSSLGERGEYRVIHRYNNGFSGFAARLSEEEAESIARRPGVVSVFRDPVLDLHTTHSWDFLKYQDDELGIGFSQQSTSTSSALHGEDIIIGIFDTGIWPESKSFSDEGLGPIPSRWKGTCMEAPDFSSSNCNRKLIGVRYYNNTDFDPSPFNTPRDQGGHGTHAAAIAAGNPARGAFYHGLAKGIARGGFPGSRIAAYRVCSHLYGCYGSAILKAFDDCRRFFNDAIADGVDILSVSAGIVTRKDFLTDPITIGAFHAVEKGILVVCSAGNRGLEENSIVNVVPWVLTVGASTIDRFFESNVVLGNNKVIQGGGIHFANIKRSPVYPVIDARSAKDPSETSESSASNCFPESLDKSKVKGKIVLCEDYLEESSDEERLQTVISLGGVGVILINYDEKTVASIYGSSPMTIITFQDADEIRSYINSTRNLVATILPTVVVDKYKPAPAVAYFSGTGPIYRNYNLIKPDVVAPGVDILAAWPSNETKTTPPFNIVSGTSMATPHVSAIAATVKSKYPSWSPSAIKSAIMTTAIQTDNLKAPIKNNNGNPATPYDFGSGQVSLSGPLQPGLVYDTEVIDYLQYLCNSGYNTSQIKLISSNLPADFSCSSNSSEEQMSNLNYPSIAVSYFYGHKSIKVKRTVANVGEEDSLYTVSVETPKGAGLEVLVNPKKLHFTKNIRKLSYQVTFRHDNSTDLINRNGFGSITWTSGKYKVRIPYVVT